MPLMHWKLSELRVAAGLSQGEVAEKSGLPLGTIRNLEQGRYQDPSLTAIEKVAAIFGVDACALIGDGKPPKTPKRGRGRPKK